MRGVWVRIPSTVQCYVAGLMLLYVLTVAAILHLAFLASPGPDIMLPVWKGLGIIFSSPHVLHA